jgi:F-type H+-transporting ATPase subunit delta
VIDTTLAKRYARALLQIGKEQGSLDVYAHDLTALAGMVQTSKDFREILANPVFTKDDKKRIAGRIMDMSNIDPMVANFVNVLIDRKRIDRLMSIEKAFSEQMDELNGITRGEVVSAEELSDEELGRVTAALSATSGKQVMVTTRVDPELIGGLMAKVGDMLFDGTIRTQLNQLKESLKG